MWGEAPILPKDVYEVFALYVEGKIPITPWCESALNQETIPLTKKLAEINRNGFLTINSQPAVNGEKSSHPVYGWGGMDGRVYQKAYVEFFTSPELLRSIIAVVDSHPNLNFYAVNSEKVEHSSGHASVTALTWGVFPNKEILQPTVFDPDSFIVWSEEVFQLWTKSWAALYDDETDSSALLYEVCLWVPYLLLYETSFVNWCSFFLDMIQIHDTYFLVAIIDNDFVESKLFNIFDEIMDHHKASNGNGHTRQSSKDSGSRDEGDGESGREWF